MVSVGEPSFSEPHTGQHLRATSCPESIMDRAVSLRLLRARGRVCAALFRCLQVLST
jgi:hypothetical protein